MSIFEISNGGSQELIRFENQPMFPHEDLLEANRNMLHYVLGQDSGVESFAWNIQDEQAFIYKVADRALRSIGVKTEYCSKGLTAFSRGFVGFETISLLVHGPKSYDVAVASKRVGEFLIDTSFKSDDAISDFDAEAEALIFAPAREAAASTEPPTNLPDLLADLKQAELGLGERDLPHPERLFTELRQVLPEQYPNTYDVIVHMGEVDGDSMGLLQIRTAGALLARSLETDD